MSAKFFDKKAVLRGESNLLELMELEIPPFGWCLALPKFREVP
jgi:hypothetical protein